MPITIVVALTLFSYSASAKTGDILYASAPTVVRDAPSEDAKAITMIGVGGKLREVSRENGWIEVHVDESGGQLGWIKDLSATRTNPNLR